MPLPLLWALLLTLAAPTGGIAQDRLYGADRRVARLNIGFAGNGERVFGIDVERGLTDHTALVTSARLWSYDRIGCIYPGPVQREDGTFEPQPDRSPCPPNGWSVSAGVRGDASVLFAEADIGLYRYKHDQVFMAPYGGVRAGIAGAPWPFVEIQVAVHLVMVSSYNNSGFDPNTWFLGAFDVGLGIPF